MIVTKAIFKGQGRVEATHVPSNVVVTTDARKPVGGLEEFQTPAELLGNALAACALTSIGVKAQREGLDITGCYAEVGEIEEDMSEITITRIPITFHLKASFDEKHRKMFERIAHKGCFVGNSLIAEKVYTFVYE